MKNVAFEKIANILFALLLLLGLGVRLVDLTDQPIDFHPTRQLRGAIIARGMYYEMSPSADPGLRQRSLAFWQSTGQYEPSILERLTAVTYLALGREVIWVARLYSILFWTLAGLFVYLTARKILVPEPSDVVNKDTQQEPDQVKQTATIGALAALAYFFVLPFSIQASRSFQPDPAMVMWMAAFVYALVCWFETRRTSWAVLGGVLAGLAVLTKAVVIYPVAGAALAIVLYAYKGKPFFSIFRNKQVWVLAVLMVLPTAVYYLARGGRASEYFSSWTLALSHLLLEPSFYLRWMNLVQELMSVFALLLAVVGIFFSRAQNRALLIGLWGGYILYGLFLPYQMYTHTYYHLMLVPIMALSIASAIQALSNKYLANREMISAAVGEAIDASPKNIGSLLMIIALSWLVINVRAALIPQLEQDYRNEPAYWQEVASHLPDDGKIIALTQDYGYRLMYYGWKKVILWPNRGEQNLNALRGSEKEFAEYFVKRTEGKRYFLITAFRQFEDQPDLQQMLYDHYALLEEGQGYLIFDLSQPK